MSLNLNKVILAGRLCTDPELKQTQSGVSVTSFRLAVNRRYGGGENGQPECDFINVNAWRGTAEFVCKYFRKGSAICVVGSLQTRSWTTQNGDKRSVVEVVADEASFVESKETAEVLYNPYTAQPQNTAPAAPAANATPAADEGDLPF